jgi:hypothetical protein
VTHVYDELAPVLGISSAVALLLLVVFLLIGSIRKYQVVLLYVSWELFATVGLTFLDLRLHGTAQLGAPTDASRLYARLYWTNDVIVDLLRFVLVTVLIYQVVGSAKPLLGRLLSGLVLAMIVLPFVLFHPIFPAPQSLPSAFDMYPRGAWFNSTSQLLNFGAAIMNVILWGALLQAKKRDPQILPVSLGLGILVTGSAIGYGLRHFSSEGGTTAAFNLFVNLTQLAAWLIWCRAFWPASVRKKPGAAVQSL